MLERMSRVKGQANSTVIFDLVEYPGFPPHGENRSLLTISGRDAKLEVFFDATEGAEEARATFSFTGVSQAVRSSFPGVDAFALPVANGSLSALVEIIASKIAGEWTAYWRKYGFPPTRHYQIVLTQANEKYDILAEDAEVSFGK
jgi:hypothetical protein